MGPAGTAARVRRPGTPAGAQRRRPGTQLLRAVEAVSWPPRPSTPPSARPAQRRTAEWARRQKGPEPDSPVCPRTGRRPSRDRRAVPGPDRCRLCHGRPGAVRRRRSRWPPRLLSRIRTPPSLVDHPSAPIPRPRRYRPTAEGAARRPPTGDRIGRIVTRPGPAPHVRAIRASALRRRHRHPSRTDRPAWSAREAPDHPRRRPEPACCDGDRLRPDRHRLPDDPETGSEDRHPGGLGPVRHDERRERRYRCGFLRARRDGRGSRAQLDHDRATAR